RVLAPVWEYFHCEKTNSHGHYSAKCSFCSTKWARGERLKLEAYLALQCSYVEDHIRQSYLLHAFIVCGISFSIVENPFFIDLLQNLCPDYQPPSREVLAGRLLDQEYAKVIVKRETIF
ncbi:24228_t:CDS:2, partial [Racocetra persica]